MSIPFVERNPTPNEVEKLRLILSTYQDGSGQLAGKNDETLPGWRDFERSVALTFGGKAQENKFIFDVLLPDPFKAGICYGISCKMRRTLSDTLKTGRVTLELSNSSGKFWDELKTLSINQQNYQHDSLRVGKSLLTLVNKWHHEVSIEKGGLVDLSKSYYFALSWSKAGRYQLFKFALTLPEPESILWDFPVVVVRDGENKPGRRLRGKDNYATIFEWYGESGGQLKYYPLVENALWKSDIFQLEPLPKDWFLRHGILVKAKDYFPEPWSTVS